MRTLLMIGTCLLTAASLGAQTIVTGKPGQDGIARVRTALNHLTVIELSEPVLSVAAGSQAFKVEWRNDKVFVEPTEAGVSTNLFIWTQSGRENYELEPAGPVGAMDFAIDQPRRKPADPPPPRPAAKAPASVDSLSGLEQWMLGGTPVKQQHWKREKHRVQVMVRDVFKAKGELFIRFSIDNEDTSPYTPGKPSVTVLKSGISPEALDADAYTQLSGGGADNPDSTGETHLPLIVTELRAPTVKPGKETVGVVGVKLSAPAVLRLEFRDEGSHKVSAVVVI